MILKRITENNNKIKSLVRNMSLSYVLSAFKIVVNYRDRNTRESVHQNPSSVHIRLSVACVGKSG